MTDSQALDWCNERISHLETAITSHRDQKADDRCWLDDSTLYAVLNDGNLGDHRIGDSEAMLANCQRFIKNRCEGGGPWKSYAELEADNIKLRDERDAAIKCLGEQARDSGVRIGKLESNQASLVLFTTHRFNCPARKYDDIANVWGACDCGLSEVLRAVSASMIYPAWFNTKFKGG
jgi:hypothetical protein